MKLIENHEKLVQANLYPEKILARSWYFGEGLIGSIPDIWLRESVYERLLNASEKLPAGLRFIIWDGWRSYELQSTLYNKLLSRIISQGIPEIQAREQASIFVAIPSKSPENVSGHLTGGSIDLTIADIHGHYLDMGGNFDETENHSYTNYYDNSNEDQTAKENRKLLLEIMESSGFSNYPNEWWHFDYGNKNWALRTEADHAFYGYTEPPFKWH